MPSTNSFEKNSFSRHADKVLGEELGRHGQGAEFLASFISDFFETLVNKIHSYGGDIIKIAGDCCKSFLFFSSFCSNLCMHTLTVPSSRSTVICFWEYRETKDSDNVKVAMEWLN